MIIAEVQVEASREDALGYDFRLLANYIFGNNTMQQDIAMIAPVQQQFVDDSWQISFVMPAKYNMETLPKSRNEHVTLNEIPAKQFVVIIFSGTNSDKNIKAHKEKLMGHIKSNNLSITGSPKYAFYNPPWTLPPMRRNEIMFEI